ncbi:hypothetical protein AB0280_17270 [Pseudarthrobacter sp902506025]|uniref:hypothetical protein n=1 Tax=Pseudarthrobacter sp. 902506025 TaxID=3155291 RepID=UPI00344EE302
MRINPRMFAVPVAVVTLLVSAGGASAAPPEVIKENDVTGLVINGCNSEEVILLDGIFRTVIKTSADGTTKQLAFIHLTGTGTSGSKYVVNQSLQDNFNGTTFSGSTFSVLVSQGPQPNETVTFSWDGDNFSAESVCHG